MVLSNTGDVGRSDIRALFKKSLKFVTFCLLSFMFITKRKRFKRNPKAWKLAKTHRLLGAQFVQNIFISCSLSCCLQGHSVKSWCNMKSIVCIEGKRLNLQNILKRVLTQNTKIALYDKYVLKSMKNLNASYLFRTRIFPIVWKLTRLHFYSAHAYSKFSCPITQRLSSVWIQAQPYGERKQMNER